MANDPGNESLAFFVMFVIGKLLFSKKFFPLVLFVLTNFFEALLVNKCVCWHLLDVLVTDVMG